MRSWRLEAESKFLMGPAEKRGYETSPASLMTSTEPLGVLPMEIFVEKQMVSEMRIMLKSAISPKYWPRPTLVASED